MIAIITLLALALQKRPSLMRFDKAWQHWRPLCGHWLELVLVLAPVLVLSLSGHVSGQEDRAAPDAVISPSAQPRWWKGNLHTHTLWSDGDDFPEMVAEWYRTREYHFLALTDHNVLGQGIRWMAVADVEKRGGPEVMSKYLARFGPSWVEQRGMGAKHEVRLKPWDEFRALVEERGKFLLIPAEEISDSAQGVPVHLNASNLAAPLRPVGGATVVEAMQNNLRAVQQQAEQAGREILTHLNHPNFGFAITAEDLAQVVLERHFEVYNGHPDVFHQGDDLRPGTERLWDIANTIRLVDLQAPPLFGIATDDSHAYHGRAGGASPGRGWTMVRATHLTPEHLIRALQAGDCYASSGVELSDVRFDPSGRVLEIDIAGQEGVTYRTQFIGSRRGVNTRGEPVSPPSGKSGRFSQRYPAEIGEVFTETGELHARYQLRGDELYVRAVITADVPPVNPSFAGQFQQAWTQPVGWTISAEATSPEPNKVLREE